MKKIIGSFAFIILLIGCVTAKNTESISTDFESKETVLATYHPNSSSNQVDQVMYGGFCCDGFGFRRCVLQFMGPVGAGCFCYGQGPGYICP